MFKSLLLMGLVFLATTYNGTDVDLSEWSAHPNGTIDLGLDGVLRSLDGNNVVLNYAQLSPDQISQFLSSFKNHTVLQQKYAGVDGRNVTDPKELIQPKKLTEPSSSLLSRRSQPYAAYANYDPYPRPCSDLYCSTNQWCTENTC
ncbi:hypothetical protein MMC12_004826, partial [Toensbergia leucococca]|nr:hypothetical protein [Toensbergia leucococca]